MNISDYAKEIFSEHSHIVPKSEALDRRLLEITRNMYDNPKQRRDRSFDEIYEANECSVAEIALYRFNQNYLLNPRPWSVRDPRSYAYDNINILTTDTFEIKRWPEDQPNGQLASWFSYPGDSLNTLRNNISLVDYVVGAKVIRHKDFYEVGFHMIADGQSFFEYLKQSMYKKWQMVYHHERAIQDGKCIRNMNVKYGA